MSLRERLNIGGVWWWLAIGAAVASYMAAMFCIGHMHQHKYGYFAPTTPKEPEHGRADE